MKLLILLFFVPIYLSAQKTPIVFVHGFLASGDTWSKQYNRFLQNGYNSNQVQVFDWNTFNGKGTDSVLNLFVDSILKINKVPQLNLVGHSAGGSLGSQYCNNPLYSKKIAHYVHIGSNKLKKPVGDSTIPTMIIYSTDDKVAQKAGDTKGAENIKFTTYDHYQVATSDSTFINMFRFFNKQNPVLLFKDYKIEKKVKVRNLYFGTNEVLPNSTATVLQYNATLGIFEGLQKEYISNNLGWWDLKVNGLDKLNYALSIQPNVKARKVTYFFEKIKTNKVISLRAFNNNSMVGMLLSQLPNDSIQPALCIFTSNQAIISGRDTLLINGIPISSAILTPANKTIIASFIYDDGDKKSSINKHAVFAAAPFMNGIDVFIDALKDKNITIEYNGTTIKIPMLPSNKSISVVVLD
jgi:Lipase (class 2)